MNANGDEVHEMCALPLAEDIPIVHNSVRVGPRGVGWRPDKPATLTWAEAQDNGDPRVEASPRDVVFSRDMHAGDADANADATRDRALFTTELRFNGVTWGDDDLALLHETWHKTRTSKTWVVTPGASSASAAPPRLLFERSYEDAFHDPGSPVLRRTARGTYVLARCVSAPFAFAFFFCFFFSFLFRERRTVKPKHTCRCSLTRNATPLHSTK